ncbi:hypothetical protein C7M84_008672 [Penaeus vannamei]|uniref:Uncharacterized protein n=1 Tax=Penaeus vannamei TaxID=6689 RepID=A0A3R7P1L6_PENVA|nr:hypothetical protein C7M84_008672 [Penaeus vannamei]
MKATPVLLLATLLGLSASFASASEAREERIFAYYSTTSVTSLTTVTITALSTCLSTATTACLGRKKRAGISSFAELENERDDDPINLEGSQSDDIEEVHSQVKRSFEGEQAEEPRLLPRLGENREQNWPGGILAVMTSRSPRSSSSVGSSSSLP